MTKPELEDFLFNRAFNVPNMPKDAETKSAK
jgi:hypothetical protein